MEAQYDPHMKSARIAVRLPDELVRRARRAVRRGRASSLSSYVATALEEKAELDDLEDLLSQMLAETGGTLTATERRTADRALERSERRRPRA